MPRAKWVVGVLTVTLLFTGLGVLRTTEGGRPAAPTAGDALPSRVLGLSGPRRLARQLENSGGHTTGKGARRPVRSSVTPLPRALPLRLVIRSLQVDVPLTGAAPADGADGGSDGGPPFTGPPETGPSGGSTPSARQDRADGAVWDSTGPTPGSAGTAVVSGDFFRISELRRGQTIEIPRADGRTAVFTVYRVSPTEVSGDGGPSGKAQLRLLSGETALLARLTGHRRAPR
ncbi:class F sortase [Streptomyces sp. ISL-43]|uniref:class F sortase n=1 Tax=Streptomyces sp. ISL-43 TaxID=2819183 RepID=UPI001BED3A36|nr:class F sortase [Streptomyces sp. ISL-43]MBT2446237.1 class F sortase [Streptomyces sp. ISL-43]